MTHKASNSEAVGHERGASNSEAVGHERGASNSEAVGHEKGASNSEAVGLRKRPEGDVLAALAGRGRLRALSDAQGIDFASNDYLALAGSAALNQAALAALERGVPVGAGASRLLRGNHPEHEALESEAAGFFGAEAALFFPTGFAANQALAATLPRRGDLILHDEWIHASFREGLAGAHAAVIKTRHNDAGAVEQAIKAWRGKGGRGRVWIAAETLYSMDGDRAPLEALVQIADRHDAMLLLDEAHATGVYGENGRGLAARWEGRDNLITLHTCGKALGAMGALLLLPRLYRDYLVNRAHGFIYSTAPSPLMAAIVRAALVLVAGADAERAALAGLVAQCGRRLQTMGLAASGSQIQPVILGDSRRALAVAEAVRAGGYDVRAIRPPTVPDGTARLRLSLTLHADRVQLDGLVDAVAAALDKCVA
jgi:8-amino-7-oxononanoate synthase